MLHIPKDRPLIASIKQHNRPLAQKQTTLCLQEAHHHHKHGSASPLADLSIGTITQADHTHVLLASLSHPYHATPHTCRPAERTQQFTHGTPGAPQLCYNLNRHHSKAANAHLDVCSSHAANNEKKHAAQPSQDPTARHPKGPRKPQPVTQTKKRTSLPAQHPKALLQPSYSSPIPKTSPTAGHMPICSSSNTSHPLLSSSASPWYCTKHTRLLH